MELIMICGVFLSLLSVLVLQYYLKPSSTANRRLPPGSTGWPVIGESIEFLVHLRNAELDKFNFKRMSKYCPDVFRSSVFGDHVAVLCGSEANKFLFSKDNKLVKTWVIRPIQWVFRFEQIEATFRHIIKPEIAKFVRPDALKNMVGVMDAMAQAHLQAHWDGVQVITTYPSVKRYAFELACRIFVSIEDPDVLQSLYDHLETFALGLNTIPINLPGTGMNRSLKAVTTLWAQVQQIVRQQAKSCDHTDNFITRLLHMCEDEMDVVDGILVVLLGGTDTVASVVCMVLKFMAQDPHIYRRVYEENLEIGTPGELLSLENTREMKYTWNVAREAMRLYPPTGFLTREAVTDFTFGGYDIPKGTKLITNIYATHKDPKYFPNPEKIDPSRFDGDGPLPYTYTPFGGGSHLCPGGNFAQPVILVFIHNVVKKFKWEAYNSDEKVNGIPFPKPSLGLPIVLYPHHNEHMH